MNKFLVFLICFTTSHFLHAHEQHAHQLITIEAYNLLEIYLGIEIPEIKNHLGSEIGYAGERAWSTGLIISGAWREDQEDVVYGYRWNNPPVVTGPDGAIANGGQFIANWLFGDNEAYTSITHFWEPDNGNNTASTLHVVKSFTDYQFTVPNAYQKMQQYVNPTNHWTIISYADEKTSQQFLLQNGGEIWIASPQYYIEYQNIIEFYKTRKATLKGWVRYGDGSKVNCNYQVLVPWKYWERVVWEVLGRMCHLLQDMSVPAHVHNDPHAKGDGMKLDPYEEDFGELRWNAAQIYNNVGGIFNIEEMTDPIHFLMYTNAQISDHFAGAGPYSTRIDDLIEGDYTQDEYDYLNSLNLSSWDGPTSFSTSLSDNQLTYIRNKLIPQAIRSTATLLYWFAKETGLLPQQITLTIDKQFEFSTSETSTQTAFIGVPHTISTPTQIPKDNFNYRFAGWSDGNGSATREFTPEANQTITAYYKAGAQLSNESSAYTNNSQRKIVRTKDGWLHQVYSSMGHVWIEHKSPTSSTWILGNDGQPLDGAAGGKNPSIDWRYTPPGEEDPEMHSVAVVYQQKYGSHYQIRLELFEYDYDNGTYGNIDGWNMYLEPTDSYTVNANPNIAWGEDIGKFALTFERKSSSYYGGPGIYWIAGDLNVDGFSPNGFCDPQRIPNTDANSISATVSLNKLSNLSNFYVVYEQYSTGARSIKEAYLSCNWTGGNWQPSYNGASTLSTASGYKNYKPSMVRLSNGQYKACWIRDLYGGGSATPFYVNAVYWSSTDRSTFNYYGNMVNSVSLNIKDNTDNTYFAYAQKTNNSTWQNFARKGTGTISLSTTGRHIQLSNGPTPSDIRASAFYPVGAPYYFQTNSLQGLSKSASGGDINYGRGLALNKDELNFNYSIKSLMVDGESIKFVEIPESEPDTSKNKDRGIKYLKLKELNEMLLSEPFAIDERSDFLFTDDAGFIDTKAAEEVLGKKGNLECKIELIDDATGKVIGLINETEYSAANLPQGKISNYSLNTDGIGKKTARVKITISSNINNLQGVFVSEYGTMDKQELAKAAAQKLELKNSELVTSYNLEQNYPNPFNPSTMIRYQLPKTSEVSLKVYDVLGKEVATLVNKTQAEGRYEVKFDASHLSSGVYIYRIEAGEYTATHKMMMLK